jgi:hypothetical protein
MGIHAIATAQQTTSLQDWQPSIISNRQEENSISVYKNGQVSAEVWAHGTKVLKNAYPKLQFGWYETLREVVKLDGWSDEKFKDAIMNCIKNVPFPEPTIANITSYDRSIKVFMYEDLLTHSNEFSPPARKEYLKNFTEVDYYGQRRYAKKEDVERFSLPKWIKPKNDIIQSKSEEKEEYIGTEFLRDVINSFESPTVEVERTKGWREKMGVASSNLPPARKLSPEERELRKEQFEKILQQEQNIKKGKK